MRGLKVNEIEKKLQNWPKKGADTKAITMTFIFQFLPHQYWEQLPLLPLLLRSQNNNHIYKLKTAD